MSEQDEKVQQEEPRYRKRETFEVLAVRLNCSENFDDHIVVEYDLRYKSAVCHNRREIVHLGGTWPDCSADEYYLIPGDLEVMKAAAATGLQPLTIHFSENQELHIRHHISVWLVRLHARLTQALYGESKAEPYLKYARIAAKTFGYPWEDEG